MWPLFLELCADAFGTTNRKRRWPTVVAFSGALLATLALLLRFGPQGVVPIVVLGIMMMLGAAEVSAARDALWRSVLGRLDASPGQPPSSYRAEANTAPTALALGRLSMAVDAARRGKFVEASDLLKMVDRGLLRPDESALAHAVLALVSLGLGDVGRAAAHASGALPTGSDDIDASLGRAVVTNAWNDARRLRSIDVAWSRAGVGDDEREGLGCLRQLVRVRLEGPRRIALDPTRAHRLADEARAVGDDELAAEIEAEARPSRAYR